MEKIWGVSKNRGKTPKMDGENNGKPYEQMDDLEVPLFLETPIYFLVRYFFQGFLINKQLKYQLKGL